VFSRTISAKIHVARGHCHFPGGQFWAARPAEPPQPFARREHTTALRKENTLAPRDWCSVQLETTGGQRGRATYFLLTYKVQNHAELAHDTERNLRADGRIDEGTPGAENSISLAA